MYLLSCYVTMRLKHGEPPCEPPHREVKHDITRYTCPTLSGNCDARPDAVISRYRDARYHLITEPPCTCKVRGDATGNEYDTPRISRVTRDTKDRTRSLVELTRARVNGTHAFRLEEDTEFLARVKQIRAPCNRKFTCLRSGRVRAASGSFNQTAYSPRADDGGSGTRYAEGKENPPRERLRSLCRASN